MRLVWLILVPLSGGLIAGCRTVFVGWWAVGGELGGGVFGFPSLSFGDGAKQQHGPGWDVGVSGVRAFPPVRPVLRAMRGLDADLFEELPNEFAAFGAVVIEGLVRPLPGHQNAPAGDAEVFGLVGFAFAASRCHGVSGALGLDGWVGP
ncbi:MAG: hypothetical protein DLM60_03300, partial [Pseudonocardiales bacterium]